MTHDRSIESFSEFWPLYVGEHRRPATRALHMAGSGIGLLFLACAIARRRPSHVLYGLVAGYGLAWIGHFVVEKNRPATFRHPVWSFMGDWKMFGLACRGLMGEEIKRLGIVPTGPEASPTVSS